MWSFGSLRIFGYEKNEYKWCYIIPYNIMYRIYYTISKLLKLYLCFIAIVIIYMKVIIRKYVFYAFSSNSLKRFWRYGFKRECKSRGYTKTNNEHINYLLHNIDISILFFFINHVHNFFMLLCILALIEYSIIKLLYDTRLLC